MVFTRHWVIHIQHTDADNTHVHTDTHTLPQKNVFIFNWHTKFNSNTHNLNSITGELFYYLKTFKKIPLKNAKKVIVNNMNKKQKTYKRLRKKPNVNFELVKAVSRLYLFMGPVLPTFWHEPDKAVSRHIPSLVQCTNLVRWTRQGSEQTYPLTGTVYQPCEVNQTRQWADISPHWYSVPTLWSEPDKAVSGHISSLVPCTNVVMWTRQGSEQILSPHWYSVPMSWGEPDKALPLHWSSAPMLT